MNQERWRRVKELHAMAQELPPDERRQRLEQECANEPGILEEVLALLVGDSGDSFLNAPHIETSSAQPEIKTRLGDFELLDVLGRGGMGVVYRARQISLDREVAVKVLPRPAAMEQRRVDRFQREARAAAKLEHSAIVPIFSVGEDEGLHYFAMQYIEGRSLAEELNILRDRHRGESTENPLLPTFDSREYLTAAAELVCDVASGLQHAHENGVVHRDVKPQNLLLDREGRVRVADFGLAKVEELGTITKSGEIAGTPYYMSPEQALAKRVHVDHRTDLFSLGVVLYELLTLQRPFAGNTSHEVLYAISFQEPRGIRKHNPRVPRDLETICIHALAKKPDQRYATAGELVADLKRFLNHEAVQAKRPSPLTRVASHVARRRNWYMPMAAAAAVLVFGALFLQGWADRREVLARVRPLQEVVEAEDLSAWPIQDLVRASQEAQELQQAGDFDHAWLGEAIARIEGVGLEAKTAGLARLRLGMASETATEGHFEPAVDAHYWAGLALLRNASLLLPSDPEVLYWADPVNSFPKLRLVSSPEMDGAEVSLQLVEWWDDNLEEPRVLGQLPLDDAIPVEPGVYRITITQETPSGTSYCELNRILYLRNRERAVVVPELRPTQEVSAGMVRIPAGEYTIGVEPPNIVQTRLRTVQHEEFWIDEKEVTNAEYRRFLQATGTPEPFYWNSSGGYDEDWDDLPAIGMLFEQARAYAEWIGKRLPTRDEWEIAARGAGGAAYPWGDEPEADQERTVMGHKRMPSEWEGYLAAVRPGGSMPLDRSSSGLFDVLGNVKEWTESINFTELQGELIPSLGERIAKGAGWNSPLYIELGGFHGCPVQATYGNGIRCAKSILNP